MARLPHLIAALLAAAAPALCCATQYECEKGTVQERARAAAPASWPVRVIADKNRRVCYFSVNAEPVNERESTSYNESSGGGSASGANAHRDAIEAVQQGRFKQMLEKDGNLALAQLLYGTNELPASVTPFFDWSNARKALADCIGNYAVAAARDRKELVTIPGAVKGALLSCGYTGSEAAKNPFKVGLVAMVGGRQALGVSEFPCARR